MSNHNECKSIIERNVGIKEFVGCHDGFTASIKKRYNDFHVNEISPKGNIHHLTSLKIPQEVQPVANGKPDRPEEINEEILHQFQKISSLKAEKVLIKSIDEQTGEKSLKLGDCDPIENVDIEVTNLNKERRTAIHIFIKSQFEELDSTTIEIEAKKYIRVKRKKAATRERNNRTNKQGHTHFIMYKENIDTMQAVSFLSSILKMKSSNFCYAGTKDKRGITSQAVSVYNVRPANILNACKPIHNVHVGDFSYSNEGLSLGMLGGNNFKIVLRDVVANNSSIEVASESLGTNGFINYYGMQRFGVRSIRTYDIGKELLHYRWKNAVDMILEPTVADTPDMQKAKEVWRTGKNAKEAFKILSARSKSLIEGILLFGLSRKHSNDFVGALQTMPRNTRTMYVHAYQSYVWNKVVSRRIKEFGLKVIQGDLLKGKQDISSEQLETDNVQNLDQKVKYVDEQILDSINLCEVVLPLPGNSIIYPNNVVKNWYCEILAEDGFTVDSFDGTVKQYTLRGAYRNILLKPTDFKWKILYYEDECKPLIQSDLEKMNDIDISQNILESGSHKAVLLEFMLPPSAYATMALRELTKMADGGWRNDSYNKRKCDVEDSSNKKLKPNEDNA